jgi:hypothetical protein
MKILARLPSREIEGADQVLEGVVIEVASGNQCRIWPAMTYDADADQTRIAFFTEWRRRATPDDLAELMAYTDSLMGKKPELLNETSADPCADQENIEWLRTGKAPMPKRRPQ